MSTTIRFYFIPAAGDYGMAYAAGTPLEGKWDVAWYGIPALGVGYIYQTDVSGIKVDAGFRWQNVTVPQGATILAALPVIWGEGTQGDIGEVLTRIYGVAADDAPAWEDYVHYPGNAARTTAYLDFKPSSWWADHLQELPDVSTIVQEIVNRPGWASGQALALAWLDNGSQVTVGGSCVLWGKGYEPYIEITYTTADPGDPTWVTPAGGEGWKEGEARTVEWAPANPEHVDGAPVTYRLQFSALGDFSDTVEIASGLSGSSYAWTLPLGLVSEDRNTCKLRIRSECAGEACIGSWVNSNVFQVAENNYPVCTLVSPADMGLVQGLFPTFTFGTSDPDSDAVHVEFQLSSFSDYRSPVIDSNSLTDYADWEEAAPPLFDTWAAMGAGGVTEGNRVRYTSPVQLRYDRYFGRARLFDGVLTGAWCEFSCTLVQDSGAALQVAIGGRSYSVSGCVITEETGGEASTITLEMNISQWLVSPCRKGETIAVASNLGDWGRTWNGTFEKPEFASDLTTVRLLGVQDDAYLSRKLCPGDLPAADLGANLAELVDTYGSPLTNDDIDPATGVSMAVVGAHKYLREHFDEARDALPTHLLYVDSAAIVHFLELSNLTPAAFVIREGDPAVEA